jgi:hypothetical protein
MGRYLEVRAALAKDPANRELSREFNELENTRAFWRKTTRES